ncbi:Hypothetical predicted protein [Paramuricea clavata]|uniref:Uncharacterized protein n=1 Tax=Paramuricea clavata TaxID=317549 RepID=A0A7D9LCC0_PARCT|nr:Hypothetical predicted protein [Paramuricea clavata]
MAAHSDDPNDLESRLDYDESDDLDIPEQANKHPEHDRADFHEFLSSLQKTMSTQTALLSILVAERQDEKRTNTSSVPASASSSKRQKYDSNDTQPQVGLQDIAAETATTNASEEATNNASEEATNSVSESDNEQHTSEQNDDRLSVHGDEHDPDLAGSMSEDEDNTSLLTKIGESLCPTEDHGPQVIEKLSQLVNTKFVMDLDLEKRKQLSEKYKTPKNCEALYVPRVNPEIWGKLNPTTKQRDIKMSTLQDLLLRVSNAVIISLNTLLDCREKRSIPDYKSVMSNLIDCIASIALIGHVHKELSFKRRDQIRPSLTNEFKPACSRNNKIEKSLFGDDLSKVLQDLRATSKVVNNLTHMPTSGKPRSSANYNSASTSRPHFLPHQGGAITLPGPIDHTGKIKAQQRRSS